MLDGLTKEINVIRNQPVSQIRTPYSARCVKNMSRDKLCDVTQCQRRHDRAVTRLQQCQQKPHDNIVSPVISLVIAVCFYLCT